LNAAIKIGILVVGGLVSYKITKVISAAMVAMGMAIEINPQTKVDMQGVQLTTNIDISNPTDSSMVLTSPFVQLLYKDETLTSNEVSSKKFEIKPFTKTRMPIVLKLSWQQVQELLDNVHINFPVNYTNVQKIMWMYNNYEQLINKLGLVVNYSTYANGINYTDLQKINI